MDNLALQILQFGKNLLIDDSDSSDENECNEKIWKFAENTVISFSDNQFKLHFRMTPSTFESLLVKIHNIEEHLVHSGHPEIKLEKQLMMTIWYLANMESFR